MLIKKKSTHIFSTALIGFLFFTTPAYAYLDPGTGSVILQIILGGIAGLVVAGKLFWSRITFAFYNIFGRNKDNIENRIANTNDIEGNNESNQNN